MTVDYIGLLNKKLLLDYPYPKDTFSGQGIVILGGGKYFPSAWVNMCMLRHYRCQLPIELWYWDDKEMPSYYKEVVKNNISDVTFINIQDKLKIYPSSIRQGWPMKPYAILYSSFDEVLYLDADNVVTQNPLFLFLSKQYKKHRTLFWPDYFTIRNGSTYVFQRSAIWDMINLKPYKSAIEAAQLLIDKERNWKQLNIALHMNECDEFYYQHLYGDKDTFLLSYLLTDQDFYLMPEVDDIPNWMRHKDFNGNPLFLHRWGDKWNLEGTNQNLDGFYNETQCKKYLLKLTLLLKEYHD